MRRIIASLDIGSNSLKLIVGEIQKNKLNVLSCVSVFSQGIKKGYIVNPESAILALKDVFSKTEELLGMPIKKVIVSAPSYNLECFITSGSTTITSEDKVIKHSDVIRSMQASVYNKIELNKELVSILPTKFIINDDEVITNPINTIANKLTVNAVAVVIPKNNTESITKCIEKIGVKVVDVVVSPLADFYEFKTDDKLDKVGAIINIGQNSTTVSIFNKGILTSSEVIEMGTSSIDNDIAYVFKINKKDAYFLKERLATADIHMADPSESMLVSDVNGEDIKINQYDVSAVVISRLNEVFNLAKKQINLLTKKEISYIIITGGICEISHFKTLVSNTFGNIAKVGEVTDIGARNNKYSVALGMIKYYNSRLKLRNAEFSMFSTEETEEFGGTHRRINISDSSLLGKIYGYFFDN